MLTNISTSPLDEATDIVEQAMSALVELEGYFDVDPGDEFERFFNGETLDIHDQWTPDGWLCKVVVGRPVRVVVFRGTRQHTLNLITFGEKEQAYADRSVSRINEQKRWKVIVDAELGHPTPK